MISLSIKSTALIASISSDPTIFSWRNYPAHMQEYVIKKSFQTQIADYSHFHCDVLKDVCERVSLLIAPIIRRQFELHCTSLDSSIKDTRELVQIQLVLKRINRNFSSSSKIFRLTCRINAFLLNKTISRINSSSLEDLGSRKKEITELFFRTLAGCHYDRSLITPGSSLEFILDDAVYKAHYQQDKVDFITNRKIDETITEALFARRLGVKLEKAHSDYHSVYYLLDRAENRLGVFKPVIYPDPQEDRYGASEDREGHLAEAASSVVDRFLETRVVPQTQLLTCFLSSSKEAAPVTGSFQFYVDGCDLYCQLEGENLFDSNHDELASRLDNSENRKLEFRNLENFALFDLITANNDHHFKNILLKKVSKKVLDLVAIDNANSFPWCHDLDLPSYKIHPNHWFKWSTLPQANKPFSDLLIDRINALDMDRLEVIARSELVNQDIPSSKEHIDGKIKTMRDRFNRIKLLANQKFTLRAIAKDLLTLTNL